VLVKVLYWVAVVLVSLALVIALILFLESRDHSSLQGARLLRVAVGLSPW